MTRFALAGQLLLPVEQEITGGVLEAWPDWALPPSPGPDVLVWGRLAASEAPSLAAALAGAVARERAVTRLRLGRLGGYRAVAIHRLTPPSLTRGRWRQQARGALLGGVLVELSRVPRYERVLDRVLLHGGAKGNASRLGIGMDGVLALTVTLGGSDAVLRVAAPHGPVDPRTTGEGLRRLAGTGFAWAPRLLESGETLGAPWTLESRLPGHAPTRLTAGLQAQVVRAWSAVPVVDGPPGTVVRDVEVIASALPHHASQVRSFVAQVQDTLHGLPAVFRHGDLWTGNLLVADHHLIGAVDWDAWAPDAVPGADLLQLWATHQRARAGLHLGEIWTEAPWRDPAFRAATAAYWRQLEVAPTDDVLHAVAVAWWATEVSGTLRRLPERRHDADWVTANVTRVVSVSR